MSDETNRGTGRTTAMIEAAAEAMARGARVLIVGHNHEYARLLAQRIGCQEFSGIDTIGERLRGSSAVPFVDHFAVEQWASAIYDAQVSARDAAKASAEAWAENERLHRELNTVKQALIRQSQRLEVSRNEAKRWRDRCPVSVADVENAGVTAEQCEAFLLAHGGYHCERFRVLSPAIADGVYVGCRQDWMEGSQPFCVAEACNRFARHSNTPAQDVLVAMQRTDVG